MGKLWRSQRLSIVVWAENSSLARSIHSPANSSPETARRRSSSRLSRYETGAHADIMAKESEALKRRKDDTLGESHTPRLSGMCVDSQAFVMQVYAPGADLIWVRLLRSTSTIHQAAIMAVCGSLHSAVILPGAEAILRLELPYVDTLTSLPFIRAFSHNPRTGSWAAQDMEVEKVSEEGLVFREASQSIRQQTDEKASAEWRLRFSDARFDAILRGTRKEL